LIHFYKRYIIFKNEKMYSPRVLFSAQLNPCEYLD